ncbi:LpxI family protein [Acidobacteriota bacterium]
MGNTRGIIAGSGEFPSFLIQEIQKRGYRCIVAGIKGEAHGSLEDMADEFSLFDSKQIGDLIAFFHSYGVTQSFFAGKIDHRRIFQKKSFDPRLLLLMAKLKDKSPSQLIQFFIEFLESQGIEVLDPAEMISPLFCEEGILGQSKPSKSIERDVNFGWEKARHLADLDIGQTIVVKDGAVVSVEGMEGTDIAIERAGQMAGEGTVVVKVSRTIQDKRVDLPAVGLSTVNAMIQARAGALCIEAGRMPFFQKVESMQLADQHNIVVVARKDSNSSDKNLPD